MEIENTAAETGAEAPVKEQGKEEQPVNLPSDESKEQGEQPSGEKEAGEVSGQSGFDLSSFEKEYAEKGELSEESYKALEKAGLNKSVVDTYIEGQKALIASRTAEIKGSVGGEAEYSRMTAWAAENLSENEKAAFNSSVNSGDMARAKLAVEGLNARYRASAGYVPGSKVEGGASPAAGGYASMAEMVRDVQDPRYRSDEAYRKKVAEKAARSKLN